MKFSVTVQEKVTF